MTFWQHDHTKVPISYINKQSLVQIGLQIFKWGHFHIFQPILQVDLRWPLTAWTYEGSHIISINQVLFQWAINFSNKAIFTFSAYLTTWPHMTFDFDLWPHQPGSHVIQVVSEKIIQSSLFYCGKSKQKHSNNTPTAKNIIYNFPVCKKILNGITSWSGVKAVA